MKRAIVTGGTGYVGHHLVKQLSNEGYFVYVLCRNVDKAEKIFDGLENISIIECELADIENYELVIEENVDVFFNLAWNGSAGSQRADFEMQLENIKIACSTIELASRLKCKKYIGVGSIMEDESKKYVPLDGRKPSPNCVYSSAKLAAHYMSKSFAANYDMDFCWARISNAYGEDDNTNRFMNSLMKKMKNGETCYLTEGYQIYDFVYVTEVARALQLIGEKGHNNCSYFIGSSNAKMLREFVEIMKNIINPNVVLAFGAVESDGIDMGKKYFEQVNLLEEHTGFKCCVSFEEGIRKTLSNWLEVEMC